MSDFDLHQLRTFVAVSRYGSVARAADALRLTASPVSRTLRDLERTTGPLFERGYHDMRLTGQGQRLLPLAVGTVRQADDLHLVALGRQPPLRWSGTPWVPDHYVALLRSAAEASGPAEEVEGAVSAVLLHRMSHGEIDVAIVHLPVSAAGLASIPLAKYHFTLAVPTGDPLVGRAAITRDDLIGRRVLVLPLAMQPQAMSRLQDWAREAGAESVEEIALVDLPLLPGRLRREHAVTFGVMHTSSPVNLGPDLHRIPFAEQPVEFLLGVAWRNDDPVRRDRLERLTRSMRPAGDVAALA